MTTASCTARSGRAASADRTPALGLGPAPRHARPRQRVRLRPGLAALPRARRRARVPHAGHGLGQPALDLELHVQPHRLVRREHGGALQVAVPGRRHAPLPGPLLRRSSRAASAGRARSRRPRRALGEAQPRRDPRTSTRRASTSTRVIELFAKYGDARFRADLPASRESFTQLGARAAGARRVAPRCGDRRRAEDCRRSSCRASTSAARPTTRWWRGRSAPAPNPLGARLRAMFSSDIGHWDVPTWRASSPRPGSSWRES